jgi:hypothetical protein
MFDARFIAGFGGRVKELTCGTKGTPTLAYLERGSPVV